MENKTVSSAPPIIPEPTNSARVLILDDDPNLCQMLKDILEEYHFQTFTVETSQAALEALQTFKPMLALVDFRLGNENGLDVAPKLKAIDPDLPIILMTAYPSLDLAVKAIQNDIYDFLSKPIETTYLLRAIHKGLEKRKLQEENKALIVSLQSSNAQLEKLNQLKSKFLSVVTHDLRTPLTSIRGYAELLKDVEQISEDERKFCVQSIERSTERMNYLVGNLLDMFSIESGRLRVEKYEMDYAQIFKELAAAFAPVGKEKNIKLEWKVPQAAIVIMGDANRLVQLLTNLISNAFKHTPEKGQITIRVDVDKNEVLTSVQDTGAGIAAEHMPRLFDQFYQVETSPTRRMGLGLGLSISKEIVTTHDGTIGVKSDGEGKGSTFYFTLPLLRK